MGSIRQCFTRFMVRAFIETTLRSTHRSRRDHMEQVHLVYANGQFQTPHGRKALTLINPVQKRRLRRLPWPTSWPRSVPLRPPPLLTSNSTVPAVRYAWNGCSVSSVYMIVV